MATLVPGEKARMYALGAIMRGGASRGGYVDNRVYIDIDGTQIAGDVLLGTLTITDALDETPNTCSFRVNGFIPPVGSPLRITHGSQNRVAPLFAGYALTVQQGYAGIPANLQANVHAVDYTWLLGMRAVTAQYRNQSATAIVLDLIARYAAANGFTTQAVAADLPFLDVITFTNEPLPEAITRVCRRVGAYWYVDYRKDVHVFINDTSTTPPRTLTPTHPTLDDLTATFERTQGLNRVLVEGRGSTILAAVPPGDTILPVDSVDMFQALPDVFLKVSFQGGESAWHVDFTGVVPSVGGSLVGPGAAPTTGPGLTTAAGGAVDVGTHDYAYTWTTAAGETRPSPLARAAPSTLPTPTIAPTVGIHTMLVDPRLAYTWKPGDYVEWAYSYSGTNNYLQSGPIAPVAGLTAVAGTGHYPGTAEGSNAWGFYVSFTPMPDLNAPWIVPWHRVNGGPWIAWNISIENSSVNQWPQLYAYNPSTQAQPATPPIVAPAFRTVNVSGLATGPASVTSRKLYRTAANQATLKLVTTIANNTATTYTDAAADATLGATAPVGDTSGIQSPTGTVNAGSTSVIVASIGPFAAAGGWAVAGEQAIRYTGLGAGALTGVPASGPGSLVGPIQYNTSIRSAPLLTGIPATGLRSIPQGLSAGDELYAVVQVDDVAGQGLLADVLDVASGIREEWISDRRLSIPEARARGQATLQVRALVDITVEYTCRDLNTHSGQTIAIDMGAHPTYLLGAYKIQQVVWANFRPRPEQLPTARVTASSRRFSFEDWLRVIKTKT
jgi:hypothetical protein